MAALEASWKPRGGLLEQAWEVPGELQSSSGGLLEASWRPGSILEASWSLQGRSRRALGAILGRSWAQMAPILGAFWEHFSGYFLRPLLAHVFLFSGLYFWDHFGPVFKGFGVHARTSRQKVPHAKTWKNIEFSILFEG